MAEPPSIYGTWGKSTNGSSGTALSFSCTPGSILRGTGFMCMHKENQQEAPAPYLSTPPQTFILDTKGRGHKGSELDFGQCRKFEGHRNLKHVLE